jgi:hypothetical protein
MKPSTITLPGIVAHLERFLRPLAATSGDGVEIRQNEHGTTVSVREGRHAATITTTVSGSLDPILVDPVDLSRVDPAQPAKLYRMNETSGVLAVAGGELASIVVTPGTLSASASDLADVVAGEIASGMTKAVFEIDPRHLLAVAEALAATGAEKATIAIAPRWNALAAMAQADDCIATFVVAGESIESVPTAPETVNQGVDGDPLDFTIGAGRAAGSGTPTRKRPRAIPLDYPVEDLPF